MRLTYLVIFLSVAVLVAECNSSKRHRKKHKKVEAKAEQPQDELDLIAEDSTIDEQQSKGASQVQINEIQEAEANKDACSKIHCGPGTECVVSKEGKGQCKCIKACLEEIDDRRKVCTNLNETWEGDCQVYRMRCLCKEGSEECTDNKYSHAHVDYYGTCREIAECGKDEMLDFPRRMREWLFNIMQDLARRAELDEGFLQLEKEAEKSQSRKWVNAVIWKFCDLDVHPHDRAVSRHELFPIRAPLLAMEHCIAPFLDECDINDDHIISLVEWGKCLGLEENEIEDKCVTIRDSQQD